MNRLSSQQFIHIWSTERVWNSEYDEQNRHHVHSFLPKVSKTCMWQIYRAHVTVENVDTCRNNRHTISSKIVYKACKKIIF